MTEAAQVPNVRLVVTDIDGTLLNAEKRVSARTRDAFQQAERAGYAIALVSSRMPASLYAVERELGVDCWKVAYDGALLAFPGETGEMRQVSSGINWAEVASILDVVETAYVGVYTGETWMCNEDGRWSRREAGNTGVQPCVVEKDIVTSARDMSRAGPIFKIMLRDEVPAVAAARAALGELALTSARWFSNSDTIVEVVPAAASKSAGLRTLLEQLRISPQEVIAFGDGHNDIPLFQVVGYAVAVANAIPELKALARHITGRGDGDGVADFLEKNLYRLNISGKR